MPIFGKEYFKDYKEKCCLMLGELVANGVMPQNAAEKEKILDIFKETDGFNGFKEVAKLKFETNSVSNMIPLKNPLELSNISHKMMLCFQKNQFTLRLVTH